MNWSFDREKINRAWQLMDRWIEQDQCPAAACVVGVGDEDIYRYTAGSLSPETQSLLPEDAIFLIASPTKPFTALAVLMLAEQGELQLTDPVALFVPEFAAGNKETITLAHCLTHTSGLPDMLPDNIALRERHAPLQEFLGQICELRPDFAPGTKVQYQSTGFMMLAEVVQRVAQKSLPDFLQQHLFDPLEMLNTSLGMPAAWEQVGKHGEPAKCERIANVKIPPHNTAGDWGWNSNYWRRLGAPWGGLLASADDLSKFCRHLLAIHRGSSGIVAPATMQAMTSNQLATMPKIPESSRRCTPWGYGWQPNWQNHRRTFGDFLSANAYGHWGATGTMLWIDPDRNAFSVLLTTEPLEDDRRRQARVSNAICAALCKTCA